MVTRGDRIAKTIAAIVLTIVCIISILPFWLMIASSLSSEGSVALYGYQLIPKEFSLGAYKYILNQWDKIGRAYMITIVVTVVGTALSVIITAMFAYGLQQDNVRGTKVIFILMIISMLMNGGIVSNYYIWTRVFHVTNTIWALILPGFLMNAFNVILVSMYYRSSIPTELYEAAEMDGAQPIGIFFKIVIPLSKPIIATVGMLTAVGYWNDWTNGLYYIKDESLYSIQQFLNTVQNNLQFLAQNAGKMSGLTMSDLPTTSARMAIAVIAILPMLIAFPFFQKFFVKGIMIGAVKG